ncbi:J domain-containing protein [Natrinema marinum]|uniref:J domain-containing protein n=1 Tax=Natrinema marinum TaxID=2961598 RepID=UPI0020C8BF4F|nr:J domain-containing protein [Natrinema marinum]
MGETYYDVLGVDPGATVDDIESAYRDRVLETHPDHSDAPDAAERFQRVTTARSVLTDGTERARYDRLGHEAYVDLAQGTTFGGNSSDADESEASTSSTGRANAETDATDSGTTDWTREQARQVRDDGTTEGSDRGRSHHARQRAERQHRRKKRRAAGEWPFDGERVTGTRSSSRTSAAAEPDGSTGNGADGFQYSVHDWDGDIDLEWDRTRIDRTTAITVAAVVLCYPLFVVASLSSLFSLAVNVVVAACTLVLIGYLLTMPRIAMAVFGAWSVLFPAAIVGFSLVEPISLAGVFALGFAWVPLGYAVALWWTLRP